MTFSLYDFQPKSCTQHEPLRSFKVHGNGPSSSLKGEDFSYTKQQLASQESLCSTEFVYFLTASDRNESTFSKQTI